jgi:hypothetical protein
VSNNRLQTMDSKQTRDQALRVADFKIDDILSVPGDQLLAEVSEDFGDPALLAAEFDAIASPALSRYEQSAVNQDAAAATVPRSSPAAAWAFPRVALAMLAEWFAAALRRRVLVGALATLLLAAVLVPGIYPRLIDHAADRLATASKDEPELTRAPAQTPSAPPQSMRPAPPALAEQSAAVSQAPPPAPASAGAPASAAAPASAFGPAPASAPAAPPAPVPRAAQRTEERPASPPAAAARGVVAQPMAAAAPPPAESARGQAPLQRQAAAKSSLAEGTGFVVQLSAARSEAEAQSTFQALKSRYAALKDREPMIRRKDQGKRGVFYAVQLGPFASQDDAQQLCDQLKAAGGTCFTTRN